MKECLEKKIKDKLWDYIMDNAPLSTIEDVENIYNIFANYLSEPIAKKENLQRSAKKMQRTEQKDGKP